MSEEIKRYEVLTRLLKGKCEQCENCDKCLFTELCEELTVLEKNIYN